jgi:hypothetical protein
MSLFRDFLRLSAVVDFVEVESLPACRHGGFSATRGGIVFGGCVVNHILIQLHPAAVVTPLPTLTIMPSLLTTTAIDSFSS